MGNRKYKSNKKWIGLLEVILGVFIMSSVYCFILSPLNLIVGGVSGISILLKNLIPNFPVVLFLYLSYIVFLLLGWIVLGKDFFLKSIFATLLMPTIVWIYELAVPNDWDWFVRMFSDQTIRYLACAVIGGTCMGISLGLLFKNFATTGGLDVIQKIMQVKWHIPASWSIYLTDGIVILSTFFIQVEGISSVERIFYALILLYLNGKISDRVLAGRRNDTACYIITEYPEKIKDVIYKTIDRGLTESVVNGGYTMDQKTMIICILTNQEYLKIKDLIAEEDPNAFVFLVNSSEVVGLGFSKAKR